MRFARLISLGAAIAVGGFIAMVAGFVASSGGAGASEERSPAAKKDARDKMLPRKLAAIDDPELKARMEQFMKLPPGERERLIKQYQQFRSLSPEQRQAIRERWQFYKAMPPDEREQVRRMHQLMQRVPDEKRRIMIEKMRATFRQVSDQELLDFIRRMNLWKMLPPEEREQIMRRVAEFRKQQSREKNRMNRDRQDEQERKKKLD